MADKNFCEQFCPLKCSAVLYGFKDVTSLTEVALIHAVEQLVQNTIQMYFDLSSGYHLVFNSMHSMYKTNPKYILQNNMKATYMWINSTCIQSTVE